ncbi:MAG TPA: type I restriction-modification enzyme R subunit C-terminal domain-containing protein [Candidatus Acidoferrum sp.]
MIRAGNSGLPGAPYAAFACGPFNSPRTFQRVRAASADPIRKGTSHAKVGISASFNTKQRALLDFVLAHYVSESVYELDREKLTPLFRLKYHDSIADAVADLGRPEEIGTIFSTFQKYLYQPSA